MTTYDARISTVDSRTVMLDCTHTQLFFPEGMLITCAIDYLTDSVWNKSFIATLIAGVYLLPLVFVVYFFAGVIKLDERWLSGDVVAYFVTIENQNPMLASLFGVTWVPPAFAVGGMLFDLFIIPALLLAPTRKLAVGALVFFHAFNYAFIGRFRSARPNA